MLHYIKKDITTVTHGIVAHGCNCSGGFGSGVAGAIKKQWPLVYVCFREVGTGEFLLGEIDTIKITPTLWVVNMYTQVNYGRDGKRYANPIAIKKCLSGVLNFADVEKLPVYIPRIGCGLGGLDWDLDVEPIVNSCSQTHMSDIYVCEI